MRWGITDEITRSNMTSSICLNEIKNCQKESFGPNFVAILSHKYGQRFLPTKLSVNEFLIFKNEVKNFKESEDERTQSELSLANLLDKAYRLDENEIPSCYKLMQIESILPEYSFQVAKSF